MQVSERDNEVCFHGGASFESIGADFGRLDRVQEVISADVLDAWFPPAPAVLARLREFLPWIARTSPPTDCEGLLETIAHCRGVPEDSIAVGAGSSNLIFLALREWLNPSSRVLLLDPTYGEYSHVCENIIGCRVDRLRLSASKGFEVDLGQLAEEVAKGYDLVVLVNPNNPTGQHIPKAELKRLLEAAPTSTTFWIDETYVDYAGTDQSLERFASSSPNVIVCKSMSKAYALSGLRVGYLCGNPEVIRSLRRLTPPWAVSLPGQIAGVTALQDPAYYGERYEETAILREELSRELVSVGIQSIIPGVANFLLFYLPPAVLSKSELFDGCASRGLYLRDPSVTSPALGPRAVRIAVKDRMTNRRMIEILGSALN